MPVDLCSLMNFDVSSDFLVGNTNMYLMDYLDISFSSLNHKWYQFNDSHDGKTVF